MRQYLKNDPWKIIEEGFHPDYHQASESIFSLGNGKMGQRANFEEQYSGPSLQGSYIAGVYYPDKTRVGWWKNGYPEYFAKVLNAPNYIGIHLKVDGEALDLFTCATSDFVRTLDMKKGLLTRSFTATLSGDKKIKVETARFLSMTDAETALLRFSVTPLNFSGKIELTPYLDGDVENEDANYDEKFWNILETASSDEEGHLLSQTKKLDFRVAFAMRWSINSRNTRVTAAHNEVRSDIAISTSVAENETVVLDKFVGVCSSLNHPADQLVTKAREKALQAQTAGFDKMLRAHSQKWDNIWLHADIKIEGDVAAQQAIRFNIFQLNQTYTGDDERLNVGPKGFTGEKYGGTTYWDTEAYCIPFFLATAPAHVTRNLLIYRYKHLQKAIENAEKLGFTNGAALYPMVTMNGEECHNEWEITFEEIHRNGAIAYAIFNYVRYTGDTQYLLDYGLEVLLEICRFWASRVTFQPRKGVYMILGVTGPNEYENNVNNNWYTNRIASWCLEYTLEVLEELGAKIPGHLRPDPKELHMWEDIVQNMYYPLLPDLGVFAQQDGFMDKELLSVDAIPRSELPLNQHWSWDRILRSCFIKQADVLQGLFFLGDRYDLETKKRNFDFYEPMTVHESSLSPCVYSIIAAEIGYQEKAYELYLRTARLDLDNYNNDTDDGLHITSMAGTWMSIVYGFGGLRIVDGHLCLAPFAPRQWKSYSFRLRFRNHRLEIVVDESEVTIKQE